MPEELVNGIDAIALHDTMDAVKENPEIGKFIFRAKNRWDYGTHCYTTIHDFSLGGMEDRTRPRPFVLEAGEPEALLGLDEGPNATECALYALATCLNTTFIYHAAAQGVLIEELELELQGNGDLRGLLGVSEDVRRGYEAIDVTFKVKADASEEKIKELCQTAQKRSPVFDIVTNPTPVRAKVEILDTDVKEEISVAASV